VDEENPRDCLLLLRVLLLPLVLLLLPLMLLLLLLLYFHLCLFIDSTCVSQSPSWIFLSFFLSIF